MTEQNGSLNRISKSSLQWLLVNKWLPLWMGQGAADCKVIDFNFMFSRDCVDCDAASAAAQMSAYGTPRLSGLPQDIVRFNARAEMHSSSTAGMNAPYRRLQDGRPLHSTLNRLREADNYGTNATARRYEDPSYENVHVQWQNGFEFGRSRDYDHSLAAPPYQSPVTNRAPLQRARSESPTLSGQRNNTQTRRLRSNTATHKTASREKFKDPFRNYELNSENNTFKPKLAKAETLDVVGAAGDTQPSTSTSAIKPSPATVSSNAQQLPPPSTDGTASIAPVSAAIEDMEGAVGGIECPNLPNIEVNNVIETAAAVGTSDNDNMPLSMANNKINSPNTATNSEQKD